MNNLTLKCPIGHFKGKGRKKQKTKRKLFMDQENLLKNPQTNWKYIAIIVILAFLVGGGIFIYFKFFVPGLYLSPCLTDFDCYPRLSPIDFLKGYRVQCVNRKCIILFPGEIQPLEK